MTDLAMSLRNELRLLWAAHARAGLTGKMCLYSIAGTKPWPAKTQGLTLWFGPDEIETAVEFFLTHYNNGTFPYTPLLLNPLVHTADGTPLGSGIAWATALTNAEIPPDKAERVQSIGATTGYVARGDNQKSGLKILAFSQAPLSVYSGSEAGSVVPSPSAGEGLGRGASDSSQPNLNPPPQPSPQGGGSLPSALQTHTTAEGCRALYDLADISGEEYWSAYLLSGVAYISNVGAYHTPTLAAMFGDPQWNGAVTDEAIQATLAAHTNTLQTLKNAAICWEKYDRHPTLYTRFGNDVAKLDENLKFFNYCARDFALFDAIGPGSVKSASKEEGGFEFLVHGLIPRGSIVLLAGTGGTGKSSIAHKLCCLAATDWRDDETPTWLGQPLVKKHSKGICVYFSGEDGPAIINARNDLFDPEKRAHRLMFQRTSFTDKSGNAISFAEFLGRLRSMPEVPLLVIDPARKYLTGDEDDSAVVSEFFEAIEQFAHDRNTSVIVVHHLSKGAKPQTAREVLDELRGSQVFIDRPRVVIGMFREGPKTVVGLAKCNIPPSLGMVITERVFAHNPKTLDLTQLPGAEGIRGDYVMPEGE